MLTSETTLRCITGDLTTKNIAASGILSVAGNAIIGGSLTTAIIGGSLTTAGDITTTNIATTGILSVASNAIIGGSLTTAGHVQSTDLDVANNITAGGNITATGDLAARKHCGDRNAFL
jgi:predicted acyltransferase (DUF342 family)